MLEVEFGEAAGQKREGVEEKEDVLLRGLDASEKEVSTQIQLTFFLNALQCVQMLRGAGPKAEGRFTEDVFNSRPIAGQCSSTTYGGSCQSASLTWRAGLSNFCSWFQRRSKINVMPLSKMCIGAYLAKVNTGFQEASEVLTVFRACNGPRIEGSGALSGA